MKTGGDISHWQGSFNAATYYASGEDFLILKATERSDYVDPTFKGRWAACGNRPKGAYHFCRPTGADADSEADHFIRTVKAAGWTDRSTWALDMEDNDGGLSAAALVAWADRWCNRVRNALDGRGLFYSYIPFIRSTMGDPGRIPGGCLGWLARYASAPYAPIGSNPHPQPKGWPDPPHVWQCSNGEAGCVKSVASIGKCDYNRMTDAAFATLFSADVEQAARPWWLEPLDAGQRAQLRATFVEALQ